MLKERLAYNLWCDVCLLSHRQVQL